MPVLVEDDLRLEDDAGPRASSLVNRWLRELPVSAAPSPNTWEAYARALREWLAFLGERGVAAFDSRDRLRAALSVYAEYRLAGPLAVRLAESSWNLHVTAVARFFDNRRRHRTRPHRLARRHRQPRFRSPSPRQRREPDPENGSQHRRRHPRRPL